MVRQANRKAKYPATHQKLSAFLGERPPVWLIPARGYLFPLGQHLWQAAHGFNRKIVVVVIWHRSGSP
jgi:hypothetical protein